MTRKKLLLLGGYGNTGRHLARLLLQASDADLVIAGRNLSRAEGFAHELNQGYGSPRIFGIAADASNTYSLEQALKDVDLVVVASSTARYTREVANAALAAQVDYLDIQYSTTKITVLKELAGDIQNAGLCFITDGGFHPGLPAALIRYAAHGFDQLEAAIVASVIKQDWASLSLPDDTIVELLEEINDFVPLIFKDGQWIMDGTLTRPAYRSIDFGSVFGKQSCTPMFLEELRSLPTLYPTLDEAGFYVGGFNGFVDWFVLPLAWVCQRFFPDKALTPLSKLMRWGLQTFSKPPFGIILKVEAAGILDGKSITSEIKLSHPDGYLFTAIPVAACLLQYLDRSIRKPGLWTQANLVEPIRLIEDMVKLGVNLEIH